MCALSDPTQTLIPRLCGGGLNAEELLSSRQTPRTASALHFSGGVVSKNSASLPPSTSLDQVGRAQTHSGFLALGASMERPPVWGLT